MKNKSLMQLTLGDEQWQQLPPAIKAHYDEDKNGENHSQGVLTIQYPRFMQWPLNILKLLGALVNKRGNELKTIVSKINKGDKQFWHREIIYPNGKKIIFNSLFVSGNNNDFIEYINSYLGLRMYPFVKEKTLQYQSNGYVLKLGKFIITIPAWLSLGNARIIEWQDEESDDRTFNMDFRIKHPIFGEVYCYKGRFTTL